MSLLGFLAWRWYDRVVWWSDFGDLPEAISLSRAKAWATREVLRNTEYTLPYREGKTELLDKLANWVTVIVSSSHPLFWEIWSTDLCNGYKMIYTADTRWTIYPKERFTN